MSQISSSILSSLYNGALFLLGLIALPKLIWQWSKYKHSLKQRLGFQIPDLPPGGPVIWIHAVSLGETRAALPLYQQIQASFPEARIVISSTTETGHRQAQQSMPDAAARFFLPLDFSFIMKQVVKTLSPSLLILVESDVWYHLLLYAKKNGARIALANGKLSERSSKRFSYFPSLAKRLFSLFDVVCVQSQIYRERLIKMGVEPARIAVTGNLKLDQIPHVLLPQDKISWKQSLNIEENDPVISIGSTHPDEEELLLNALLPLMDTFPSLKILLVPRHPERFAAVYALLQRKQIASLLYSRRHHKTGKERVILIDAMGLLPICYQLSDVALVGGSFVPGIGGHNLFEPASLGIPTLFGPYMHAQPDLAAAILSSHAGLQLPASELPQTLSNLLKNRSFLEKMSAAGLALAASSKGASERTWKMIKQTL